MTYPAARSRTRRFATLALVVTGTALAGCNDPPPPRARPTTLVTYPHAMDRLARLNRAAMTDPHPQPIQQAIACETYRVEDAIGRTDFDLRMAWLNDSIAHEFSRDAISRMEDRMAGAVIESGNSERCNSTREEAKREVPLPVRKHRVLLDEPITRASDSLSHP